MSRSDPRSALAQAAEQHGVDLDPDVLLRIVLTAFAPRESMTATERRFLVESGAPDNSFDPERQAIASARLLAIAAQTAAHASPTLTASEVATMLGRGVSTVRRAAGKNDLYAWRTPDGSLAYPGWQFVNEAPLPGLRPVLDALPDSMHPLSVEGWFSTPHEELNDQTPINWLAAGRDHAPVAALADSHARD